MNTVSGLLIMTALLVLNAIFVAAEFSLLALDRARVEVQANQGSRVHRSLLRALKRLTLTMSGCQLGITLSALMLGFVAEPTMARLLTGDDHPTGLSVLLAIFVATVLHLIIGEQVPKYIALAAPESTSRKLVPLLSGYSVLVRPLVRLLNGMANSVVRRFGVEPRDEIDTSRTSEELETLITERAAGVLHPEEVSLLTRSLRFSDKTAVDVLIPRVDISALQRATQVSDLITQALDTGRSRFPVFDKDLDDIIGVVHVKSVYRLSPEERRTTHVSEIMRDVLAVPETRKLEEILSDMRRRRTQMAVVIDEHGATSGIITLEDLLEEILGEIKDEYDNDLTEAEVENPGSFLVAGRLNFDEVFDATGFRIPEGQYETIAGFVLERLGHLAEPGEKVFEEEWTIEVVEVKQRRIITLRVTSL
jgi:CBS domain containing-hemolysin-like protein